MQRNKNGILVQTPKKRHKRVPLSMELGQVYLQNTIDGVEVVIVLPHFSPVINMMTESGYKLVEGICER